MNRPQSALALACLAMGAALSARADVVEGTFTAVVISARDPGQAAFGRDPLLWVGQPVQGTFSYDVDTGDVREERPSVNVWNYFDPARNTRWVYVTATIDGVTFATSARDANPAGTIGGIVGIWDGSFGAGDWYGVQDAYLSFAGRSLVGFDVFGPAGLFAYAGSGGEIEFDFDPAAPGVIGLGLIEDIAVVAGTTVRDGAIRFQLTSLTFGQSIEALLEELLASATGTGPGGSLADKIAIVQAYVAAGDTQSACGMLHAFTNQVTAQSGKKITVDEATQLAGQAQVLQERLGCE